VRLIVNADDLGSSRKVNDAIFELMKSGSLSSASILVNGRAFGEAVSRIAEFPGCSFGIHLNATEGAPLLVTPELAPILDDQLRFQKHAISRLANRADIRQALLGEWVRQMTRLKDAGVRISHIDSHNNVHNNPWLFGTLKKLQNEFNVRRIRIAGNLSRRPGQLSVVSRVAKAAWASALKYDGTRTTDRFGSLLDYWQLTQMKIPINGSTAELMVHPGLEKYRDETDLLLSEWWFDQMRTNELINDEEL
jgi:predicted glycoside hydrolase/deacetylase ChbG (UPF0249 family)